MQPYSLDLRTRIAAACQQPGARKSEVARRFGVSRSFVKALVCHERDTGSLMPKPARGGRARYLDADAQAWLVAYVKEHPDTALAELNTVWQATGGRSVGQTCIWQVLNEHGLRRKKSLHATERDTARVRAQRQQYVEGVAQRPDVARFHFLDETGLRLDQCRRYGRAVGGQRVSQARPLNRGRALTLIGALSVQGLGAVQVLEGALNHRSFAFYLTQCLAPSLQLGDVLVLDNLSVHKLSGVGEWLAERGIQVLFLPPYSPDFAPVEQAWSKLKTKLRQTQARTRQALEAAVQAAVDWITSQDAKNWFDHCGYYIQPA